MDLSICGSQIRKFETKAKFTVKGLRSIKKSRLFKAARMKYNDIRNPMEKGGPSCVLFIRETGILEKP